MKILVVSSYLPYPLFSGGSVRLYNLLKEISKDNEITLICEKRNSQTIDDIRELEKICKKVITVPRRKQWSLSNIIKSVFSKNSFLITGHILVEMKKKIEEELRVGNYDLIHVETFYVMQNLPFGVAQSKPRVDIPVVLVEHNIEYLVYKRFVDKASGIIRPFLRTDVNKIKKQEEEFWKKASKLVAVSDEEKALMKREDVVVVRNGVDTQKYQIPNTKYQIPKSKTVLFIGDFKWIQNQNAIKTILDEIWPKVHAKNKDLKLWVVGKNIPEDIKNRKTESVVFDENAPDKTEEIYEKSDILLAPIAVGGGTSFKILEAMASGVAVVTTSLGAEGIVSKKQNELIIADSAEEQADGVIKLAKDNESRLGLIKNARKVIEEKYDWQNIAKELEYVYKQALK